MPSGSASASRSRQATRRSGLGDDAARVLSVGCREGNIDILQMLPTDIPAVMERLKVTKMPANRRVNDLMEVGLLERELGTGRLLPTPLTGELLRAVDTIAKRRRRDNA